MKDKNSPKLSLEKLTLPEPSPLETLSPEQLEGIYGGLPGTGLFGHIVFPQA